MLCLLVGGVLAVFNMGGNVIGDVGSPSANTDLATVRYLDSLDGTCYGLNATGQTTTTKTKTVCTSCSGILLTFTLEDTASDGAEVTPVIDGTDGDTFDTDSNYGYNRAFYVYSRFTSSLAFDMVDLNNGFTKIEVFYCLDA